MKTKYIFILASAFFASFALSSCKGDFLETNPRSEISFDDLSKDTKSLNTLVEGVHNRIYTAYYDDQSFGAGYSCIMSNLDPLGDDLINTRPSIMMDRYRYTSMTDTYYSLTFMYYDYWYTLVMYSNQGLEALKKLPETSEGYKQLKGEFLTIRALSYFNLVQLFAKRYEPNGANDNMGVPLRTTPTYDAKPRATVKEVYAQIDKDIAEAVACLRDLPPVTDASGSIRKNRINSAIALNIASRIALVEEKWADAEALAAEAIEKAKSWGLGLVGGDSLLDGFNNMDSREWLWGYKLDDDQNQYFAGFNAIFSGNFSGGYNQLFRFAVNREIYDKMGPNDVRRKWWICQDLGMDATPYKVKNPSLWTQAEETGQSVKFASVSPSSSMGDMLVMRLPEVYFNKAEAQARQGKDADAKTTLNELMVTRDPDYQVPADAQTGDKLIEEIFRNKRIELWLEGFRFFDLKRTRQPIIRTTKNVEILKTISVDRGAMGEKREKLYTPLTDLNDPRWELQIPYDEVKGSHGKIILNPIYVPKK